MAAVAYGIRNRREILRAVGGIYLISVVLGGVMLALAESSPGRNLTKWMPESFLVRLFLAAGAVCLCVWLSRFLRLLSIRKEENRHLRNVTLFYAGQTIKTRGLIDTGNHLKAPVSGLPVHVATASLPGSKRGHVCSLSMHRQQRHPSSCKNRRNESGRREGKLCDTKTMDRYNKGKLIST